MKTGKFLVIFILAIFFVISLITNILGPIIPDIIGSFRLSLGLAGFLPFAFFVAYGIMSVPAGFLVERYAEKRVLTGAFLLILAGSLAFAVLPLYGIALMSLFIIGSGMAVLQVAINPLLRQAGGEVNFAFNSVLAQLVFGGASFLSPMLYSYLVQHVHHNEKTWILRWLGRLVPEGLEWVALYWVFVVLAFVMLVLTGTIRFPRLRLEESEKAGSWSAIRQLLKNRYVILFFAGIFAYVGTEQGIANWMSQYMQVYHQLSPETDGAVLISRFWGLLTAGCLLGLVLLKFIDSKKVLIFFSAGAIVCLLLALLGGRQTAVMAFPATGFFMSVMWSVIFSLALNSVKQMHGAFSGILCTGIVGGAVIPLVVGVLGDWLGLKAAMFVLFVPLGYILSIGIWARPVIRNKTIRLPAFLSKKRSRHTD